MSELELAVLGALTCQLDLLDERQIVEWQVKTVCAQRTSRNRILRMTFGSEVRVVAT